MNTETLGAAIDDGLLNIEFKVLGFETVFFDNMGNAVPELKALADYVTTDVGDNGIYNACEALGLFEKVE